jgi:type I restriction enzyme M protein
MIERLEDNSRIYSHIRKKWLIKTPEEIVRQEYLCVLINNYGYSLEQIKEEENVTGRGSAQARADFVIYKNVEDLQKNNNPLIIVEVKAEHIAITEKEFIQGELYARIYNAPFFVTHNGKETKFWRVKKDKSPGYREEIENIPQNKATDKEIQALFAKLKVFREKEFKYALEVCHNIIRNNEKLDPAAAFDEIAKILFMKVYAERNLRKGKENVFSLEWVEEAEKYTKDFIQKTFDDTKTEFGRSVIFRKDEKINLKSETIKAIIQKFEKYNLSETSVDTKGIAFENFLNTTFRGELGQFFTPRPVVEFMIDMLNPQENETVCDPACGSGGFLIRFFQKVQESILENINNEYQQEKQAIEAHSEFTAAQKAEKILALFQDLEHKIDITKPTTKLWNLANHCIFGTDANERMARIAKMNMIMHGDGHGGIHHHDGFINVADIQDNTFDIILTNPPFGMKENNREILKKFKISAHKTVITTQILFVERCINLLKESGKMAILLPNNVFNGSESKDIREFVEDNGFILSTITLPRETFLSSNADVNCSLLFFQKFTEVQKKSWEDLLANCKNTIKRNQYSERIEINNILQYQINKKDFPNKENLAEAVRELKNKKKNALSQLKELDKQIEIEGRKMAKITFSYTIFMFEADLSGITATGETTDKNDLIFALQDYANYLQKRPLQHLKSVEVQFANLNRWDAKSYLYKLISPFPLNKLGNYIYEHSEKIKLFDFPEDEFPILGVTNKEGVYLNFIEKGETFNQPYKKVKYGELTYNPYRVNVGSIGLVDEEFDNFYISPAYIVFGIKEEKTEELLKEYLYLVLSSDWFNPLLRAATSGSVRQNLTFDLLADLEIPIPNIEKQKEIVVNWLVLKTQEQKLKETLQNFKNDLSEMILEK